MTYPNLWITQINPAGPSVGFGLVGDSQLTRSSGTGTGGWQLVDRPWRAATTEWVDYGPFELTMTLILDSTYSPQSLEQVIGAVESWEVPATGSQPPMPPLLSVSGPVPHNDLTWVVYNLNWKDAIRDSNTGVRYQQSCDIVLWQYLPPTITVIQQSPASASNTGQSGSFSYTVKAGDTLPSIAAAQYGNWQLWTVIAQLNGVRDPNTLVTGQVLQMPAVNSPSTTNGQQSSNSSTPPPNLFKFIPQPGINSQGGTATPTSPEGPNATPQPNSNGFFFTPKTG